MKTGLDTEPSGKKRLASKLALSYLTRQALKVNRVSRYRVWRKSREATSASRSQGRLHLRLGL